MLPLPSKLQEAGNDINQNFREDANRTLSELLKCAIRLANAKPELVIKNCISCNFWNEQKEICNKYQQKPPARVIAFGCPDYLDMDEIPF